MVFGLGPGVYLAEVKTFLSTGYSWALGDTQYLEEYWSEMAQQMDEPPDPAIWNRTIPYSLWGDEGTLPNSASWMFGTLRLTITPAYPILVVQLSKVNLSGV